jgi:hypothetical protein
MDLKATECEGVEQILLAQNRDEWRALVETVMKLRAPLNTGNFLNDRTTISYSRTQLHGANQFVRYICGRVL